LFGLQVTQKTERKSVSDTVISKIHGPWQRRQKQQEDQKTPAISSEFPDPRFSILVSRFSTLDSRFSSGISPFLLLFDVVMV